MNYTREQTAVLHDQTFAHLLVAEKDHVLTITLNRPAVKNALNRVMTKELAFALNYAHYHNHIWAVVLEANGPVFCAGADLKSFAGDDDAGSTVPEPDGDILIGELFHQLHKPCIAKVAGDVYAGGFLLLAGCTHVVAADQIVLGLPEVKRGLFPFQVMASLLEVMPARKVLDWCIRGYSLPVQEALNWGLVTQVCTPSELEATVAGLLSDILVNSPSAIRLGLQAYARIRRRDAQEQHQYLLNMFMQTFQTRDAQEGIQAFREKRPPVWRGE